jgi:hypothetical protein
LFLDLRSWCLCSWAFLVPGVRVLGVALIGSVTRGVASLGSPGSPRESRQSSASDCLALFTSCGGGCFEGVSGRGYMREVEDILLSERDGGSNGKGKDRAFYM